MSFSGKKYRRVRCERIEELVKSADQEASSQLKNRIMSCAAPTFCFTRIDEHTLDYCRQTEQGCETMKILLGREQVIERINGSKVWMTSRMEGDNVLRQIIRRPDGKTACFTRYFGEKDASMVVSLEGSKVEATIFYQRVED